MIHLVLVLSFVPTFISCNFVADTNADLTANILKNGVSSREENLVFSPASLMYGIAMLYEGMGDSSRRVINNALNFPSENEFRNQFRVSSTHGYYIHRTNISTVEAIEVIRSTTIFNVTFWFLPLLIFAHHSFFFF